jgi:uncharacterized membrane protein YozB (DUF420 family)
MLYGISTLVLLLIALGWKFRRQAKLHIAIMSVAFLIDLALLLYIEISRHAIAHVSTSVMTAQSDSLLYFHVTVSALTLVLYIVQISSGIKLFKGLAPSSKFHQRAAMLFVACRLLNYATSFFIPTS